jgi:serine/threonine-protein kinase
MPPATEAPLQDERFLLLETLGRGGMGIVFRAFDRTEQRLVALKVLGRNDRAGPAHPLSSEFDTWSRLEHPNIVRVYELRQARRGPLPAGAPYLVLEHVAGGPAHRAPCAAWLAAAGAEALARQLLAALDHVHVSGFVHRDLKPANVLVTGSRRPPRVKLTDFGLAARVGEARPPLCLSGSLHYAAPEALLGLPLDGRADLYALGILLYRLITGEHPVGPPAPPQAILGWHLSGPPADPLALRPRLSPRLARFIRRLTQRDRDARPATAREALATLGDGPPLSGRRPVASAGAGERAALRLALDAARLGDFRVFGLPRARPAAEALVREVAIWGCALTDSTRARARERTRWPRSSWPCCSSAVPNPALVCDGTGCGTGCRSRSSAPSRSSTGSAHAARCAETPWPGVWRQGILRTSSWTARSTNRP